MPTLKIRLEGMRSASDETRVEELVRAEQGVFGAVASHRNRCVEVDFEDDEESVDRLLLLLREAGFRASLAG